jgi:hypothetical protein
MVAPGRLRLGCWRPCCVVTAHDGHVARRQWNTLLLPRSVAVSNLLNWMIDEWNKNNGDVM